MLWITPPEGRGRRISVSSGPTWSVYQGISRPGRATHETLPISDSTLSKHRMWPLLVHFYAVSRVWPRRSVSSRFERMEARGYCTVLLFPVRATLGLQVCCRLLWQPLACTHPALFSIQSCCHDCCGCHAVTSVISWIKDIPWQLSWELRISCHPQNAINKNDFHVIFYSFWV